VSRFSQFPQHQQLPPPPPPSRLRTRAIPILGFIVLAAGSLLALRRADAAFGPPVADAPRPAPPVARLAASALGRSRGQLRLRFPEAVQFR
jgi:hypothetical protein